VDGVEAKGNGWKVAQDVPQAAVFRCVPPLKMGRLRVWLSFYGAHGAAHFGEFSLAATTDPKPALAGRWESIFPVSFNINQGQITRAGEHLRIVGEAGKTYLSIDSVLPFDAVTGVRIEVWPSPGKSPATAVLTEFRADRAAILTTNVALGCPVTASHDLGPDENPRFLTDGLTGTFANPGAPDLGEKFFFEIDLRRVRTIDHIALRSRAESSGMGRFSRLHLQLFDEKPTADGVPVWSGRDRADGTYPEPGDVDVVRASAGQGEFHGRYLRISSSSPVAFSPQIAEVEVYESVVVPSVAVKANDRPIDGQGKIRIPSTTNWLTFTLVNPLLHDHLSLGRRWRIVGAGKEWLPGNATGVLESRGLPVGEYLFEVQLRHTDFQWNEASLRLPFVVLTPWWQKPVTQIAAVLLLVTVVALLAWPLARYRVARQIAELERGQELANERRRIARDMHDVVGARLTQLTVMHELFAAKHQLSDAAQSQVRDLMTTTRAAITAFDETVWAVNPRNDTLQNLADYLSYAASDYLRPLDIACRQEVQEALPEKSVGAQKRHALLLAFKEALQNIAKHAGATIVTLTLRFTEPTLVILLDDNGRGLPPDLAGPEKDGLENMRARLAEVGGACAIRPRAEGGTQVEMRLTL
jgi:signal transduction histidine kinase